MEIWKSVAGIPGYEVSSLGNIRHIKYKRNRRFQPKEKGSGYLTLLVRERKYRVHQLVARTFLGEYPEGYEINHKDGNPSNNRIENLEYVSRKENQLHKNRGKSNSASITETPRMKRYKAGFRNMTKEQLEEIRKAYYSSSTLTMRQLANQYEMSIGKMSNILNS